MFTDCQGVPYPVFAKGEVKECAFVVGAIPLCHASNDQWIVTKSGNLGNNKTIIEVMKYFER